MQLALVLHPTMLLDIRKGRILKGLVSFSATVDREVGRKNPTLHVVNKARAIRRVASDTKIGLATIRSCFPHTTAIPDICVDSDFLLPAIQWIPSERPSPISHVYPVTQVINEGPNICMIGYPVSDTDWMLSTLLQCMEIYGATLSLVLANELMVRIWLQDSDMLQDMAAKRA